MKNEQGFSLVELLIVVAIIAIIAAIAVPSLLTARMAANESASIQGCRTVGSAEIAFSATNNQNYDIIANLVTTGFLDSRYSSGIDGYTYADAPVTVDSGTIIPGGGSSWAVATSGGGSSFAVVAAPNAGMGRFTYGIGPDQIVRYQSAVSGYTLPTGVTAGDGLGLVSGGS